MFLRNRGCNISKVGLIFVNENKAGIENDEKSAFNGTIKSPCLSAYFTSRLLSDVKAKVELSTWVIIDCQSLPAMNFAFGEITNSAGDGVVSSPFFLQVVRVKRKQSRELQCILWPFNQARFPGILLLLTRY